MDLPRFLSLSATLTGVSAAELQATGLAESLFHEVRGSAGIPALQTLADAVDQALEGGSPEAIEERMQRLVLSDPAQANGPLARRLIQLWFTGTWLALPPLWHTHHGGDPQDVTRVISAAAYRESLVWPTIGSHPQSAKQPGFGTWSLPPRPFQES